MKLRKTGNSLRLLRLETKRNELGIFFPEAAERLRQNGDGKPSCPVTEYPSRPCRIVPARPQHGKKPALFGTRSTPPRVHAAMTSLEARRLPRPQSPLPERTLPNSARKLPPIRQSRRKDSTTPRCGRKEGGNTLIPPVRKTLFRSASGLQPVRQNSQSTGNPDSSLDLPTLQRSSALPFRPRMTRKMSSKKAKSKKDMRPKRLCPRRRSIPLKPLRTAGKARRKRRKRRENRRKRRRTHLRNPPVMVSSSHKNRRRNKRAKPTEMNGKQRAAALVTESTRSSRRQKTKSACNRWWRHRRCGFKILSGHRRS